MPKCVYCEKDYEFPRGVTLVTNKGAINYLCSSKCRKNMAMGRRKVRWISNKKPLGSKTQKKVKPKSKSKKKGKKKE